MNSTQVKYPWRAVARTTIAATVGILPLLPVVAHELGIETIPWVATTLAVTAAVTRILANASVVAWLDKYFPALSPAPPEKPATTSTTSTDNHPPKHLKEYPNDDPSANR